MSEIDIKDIASYKKSFYYSISNADIRYDLFINFTNYDDSSENYLFPVVEKNQTNFNKVNFFIYEKEIYTRKAKVKGDSRIIENKGNIKIKGIAVRFPESDPVIEKLLKDESDKFFIKIKEPVVIELSDIPINDNLNSGLRYIIISDIIYNIILILLVYIGIWQGSSGKK